MRSSGSRLNDDISRSQTHQIVRRGLALVPAARLYQPDHRREPAHGRLQYLAGYARLRDRMYALFPRLKGGAIRWRAP